MKSVNVLRGVVASGVSLKKGTKAEISDGDFRSLSLMNAVEELKQEPKPKEEIKTKTKKKRS